MEERPNVHYYHTDDNDPLDGTIYDWLSTGLYDFTEWLDVNKKQQNSDVLLGTYPHPIVLTKYVIVVLIMTILAVLTGVQASPAYGAIVFGIGGLYMLIGLHRYWKHYFVITEHAVIEKQDTLLTNDGTSYGLDRSIKVELEHPHTAKLLDPLIRDFGTIHISTYTTDKEKEIDLKNVPVYRDFMQVILEQANDADIEK